jgi:hypothetical protein
MTTFGFVYSAAKSEFAKTGSALLDLMLATAHGELVFLGNALALNQQFSCGGPTTRCPDRLQVFKHIRSDTGIDLVTPPNAPQQRCAPALVVSNQSVQVLPLSSFTGADRAALGSGGPPRAYPRHARTTRLPLA